MNLRNNGLWILSFGIFSIINTEMGVIGILPLIAHEYGVGIPAAGLLVSLFALAVAVSGPVMPLLFSGMNRKNAMLLVLGIFVLSNLVSMFSINFTMLLIVRVIPAFLHPVYCALAFTMAAESVTEKESPKAVAKVLVGVSAGMVLGVPVMSLISGTFSLGAGMLGFTLMSLTAFMLTLWGVRSPGELRKPAGVSQLKILKKPHIWLAMSVVVLLNGAIFGVFSYFADYLTNVTGVSGIHLSLLLLLYGAANIAGNLTGGKLLSQNAFLTIMLFPLVLGGVYGLILFFGESWVAMVILTLAWGILGGAGANINQYYLTRSMPEAPNLANGLFLTSANGGTVLGATLCGLIIGYEGSTYIFLGGIVLSALGLVILILILKSSFFIFGNLQFRTNSKLIQIR